MIFIKNNNRSINLAQVAHTEYKPPKQTDVQSRTATSLTSKSISSVSSPSQYLIVFSSGAELKLSGTEADEVMQAIENSPR